MRFSYLPKTFSLIWAASRNWTIAWILLLVVQGLLPGITVYLTRYLVNNLLLVANSGISEQSLHQIMIPGGAMIAVLLLTEFLQAVSEWVRTAQSELVQDYISSLIHKQSIAIDYACYESSEYNDYLERARQGANGRPLALLENSGSLLQSSITLFTMAAILIQYGLWLPVILFLSALPAFYTAIKVNLKQYKWSQGTTTERRKLNYYDFLLTNEVSAAELRLFNFGAHFQAAYQKLRYHLRHQQLKLVREQTFSRLLAGIMALLITTLALAWMGKKVLLGIITLGDLALFYQGFNQGQSVIKSLLRNLGEIYKNSLFVANLFEFLQIKPQIIDPTNPQIIPLSLKENISISHVTFRYPGSKEAILKDFSLTIPSGKIVAIVGDNGAGKSTLLKLLCRLYDPESGKIELDGTNINEFSLYGLRGLISVLFQSPISYYFSAGENIALGDLSINPSQKEIETAAMGAGIHKKISRLPQGYETLLGKLFAEGTDLSGGEWQRLALARAFLRKSQIIILDEPTSAMDPWAEFDWLERFRTLANGRTSIVITHRFTLAMRADIIHVMKSGHIVESGSHDELITQNGFYAQSWRQQMQTNVSLANV